MSRQYMEGVCLFTNTERRPTASGTSDWRGSAFGFFCGRTCPPANETFALGAEEEAVGGFGVRWGSPRRRPATDEEIRA